MVQAFGKSTSQNIDFWNSLFTFDDPKKMNGLAFLFKFRKHLKYLMISSIEINTTFNILIVFTFVVWSLPVLAPIFGELLQIRSIDKIVSGIKQVLFSEFEW